MKFKYDIELKEGYKPVLEDEVETEISFVIVAKNRATADRMVKAMFQGSSNIVSFCGISID